LKTNKQHAENAESMAVTALQAIIAVGFAESTSTLGVNAAKMRIWHMAQIAKTTLNYAGKTT
jgi:hypothetical protein